MNINNDSLPSEPIRLNKLLARYGLCSRRKADEWIQTGRVAIDGIICREMGTQVDPTRERITVDGKDLEIAPELTYIAFNKPINVLCTKDDPQGRKTVMDCLSEELNSKGIFPVGRLDQDSEGLLLLTNNGDWAQVLVHPKHEIWKEYFVITDKPLHSEKLNILKSGVNIEGQLTLPAKIRVQKGDNQIQNRFYISIREGRNRQIRKMCKAVGLNVQKLKRTKIGPIQLGNLKLGNWRHLSDEEIQMIEAL
jgi:pseudouridine synthase